MIKFVRSVALNCLRRTVIHTGRKEMPFVEVTFDGNLLHTGSWFRGHGLAAKLLQFIEQPLSKRWTSSVFNLLRSRHNNVAIWTTLGAAATTNTTLCKVDISIL